jgi:hypothetical protein
MPVRAQLRVYLVRGEHIEATRELHFVRSVGELTGPSFVALDEHAVLVLRDVPDADRSIGRRSLQNARTTSAEWAKRVERLAGQWTDRERVCGRAQRQRRNAELLEVQAPMADSAVRARGSTRHPQG